MVIQFIGAYDVVKFLKGEASCRFATAGTHDYSVLISWRENACGLRVECHESLMREK